MALLRERLLLFVIFKLFGRCEIIFGWFRLFGNLFKRFLYLHGDRRFFSKISVRFVGPGVF